MIKTKLMENKNRLFLIAYWALPQELNIEARYVFFKILKHYGCEYFPSVLSQLSQKINVKEKCLSLALRQLMEGKLIEEELNLGKLKLNIELLEAYLKSHINFQSNIDKWLRRVSSTNAFPLYTLFNHLLIDVLDDFHYVSLQNRKVSLYNKLDFKCALVLVELIRKANRFGINDKCGIGDLKHHTGLSKDAIFRCVHKLKQQGIIRLRINGALNSKILKDASPVYVLNLSHEIWGKHTCFGQFFFLENSFFEVCEVQYIGSLLKFFDENARDLKDHYDGEAGVLSVLEYLKYSINLADNLMLINKIFTRGQQSTRGNYCKTDSYLVKLLESFFELNTSDIGRRWLLELISYSSLAKVNKGVNTLRDMCTLFEVYLEQICLQIYYKNNKRKALLSGTETINIDDIYDPIIKSNFYKSLRLSENDDIHPQIRFLSLVMTLIAYHKIAPFLHWCEQSKIFKPFMLIPSQQGENKYFCIFMIDSTLTKNDVVWLSQDSNKQVGNVVLIRESQSIIQSEQEDLKQLQALGIMSAEAQSLDTFIVKSNIQL